MKTRRTRRSRGRGLSIGAAVLLVSIVVSSGPMPAVDGPEKTPAPEKPAAKVSPASRAGDAATDTTRRPTDDSRFDLLFTSGDFKLPEEKQKYIWQIEHLSVVLSQDVVPLFRQAIEGGESDALKRLLAPDFHARVFSGRGEAMQRSGVSWMTWNEGRAATKKVTAEPFIKQLSLWGGSFAEIEKIVSHMTSLAPVEHGNLDGRWTTKWELNLKGKRPDGHRAESFYELALTFARLDEEMAKRTGWIESARIVRSWRVSTPAPLMEEITDSAGIDVGRLADNWKRPGPPYPPVNGGAHLLDFDRDGRTDLLVTGTSTRYLYRGLASGGFEEVTGAAGLPARRYIHGAYVADFDNDGYEDVVLGSLDPKRKASVDVYRNRRDGTFERVDPAKTVLTRYKCTDMGVGVADFDGDGLVDIYLAEAAKDGPAVPMQKARWLGDRTSREGVLLRNLGDWRFEDVTKKVGLSGESVDAFAVVWLDLEPDGDPDLFLANHMGANVLWENQGDGTFAKLPLPKQGFGGFSMGATAGDLDGDGDPDLYLSNMYSSAGSRVMENLRPEDYPPGALSLIQGFITGNELFLNRRKEGLVPIGVAAGVDNSGWSYGPAVVDLDGDGNLDLYAPAGFQSVERGKPDG